MQTFTKILISLMVVVGGIYFLSKNSSNGQDTDKGSVTSYHIILGLDPSGTTKGNGWPWPTITFFEQQVAFLAANGGGVLEVYNFSNPIPKPVKISIESLKPVPDVYSGEGDVKKAKSYNEAVTTRNENSKTEFWNRLDEEIISFKPVSGQDYTYAAKHCNAIKQSFSLPQYSRGFVSLCFLYSDLMDDVPKSKPKIVDGETLDEISSISNLAICNHSKNKLDVRATEIPSYTDFLGLLNSYSLTLKHKKK